jgi:hypothetical protein
MFEADKNQIYSFTIITDKEHLFEPVSHFAPEQKNGFVEVLVKNDSSYSLIKQVKTTRTAVRMINVKLDGGYNQFSDKASYYISFKNGLPKHIHFNKKSIMAALSSSKADFVNAYFKQFNSNSRVDLQFVTSFLQKLNEKS